MATIARFAEPLKDIMRVNEIMSAHVKTVPLTASADDAWEMMRGERIHHLVVMDGKKDDRR